MPFFSVVIPLYNKENYIKETLQSVLAQTFTDFEIIVVNDVSTDNSAGKAEQIKDQRIRIINHEINCGLSPSRNTGIINAKADYIAFLDADDLWKPEFLATIRSLILRYSEASLFATKYTEIYYGKIPIEPSFRAQTGIIDNFFIENLNKPIYCPSSLCVKKSVFEAEGFYKNVYLGEDTDFNIRANLKYRLAYSAEPLVLYRMHSENQITHNKLAGRTIVDFDFYQHQNPDRADLRQFLDFQRYMWAKRYKMEGSIEEYRKLAKVISPHSLNYKQRILLKLPQFALQLIRKLKAILHKKGLNPTSY
jgi:glycosyltransferase involved in cell wall biosynthesis